MIYLEQKVFLKFNKQKHVKRLSDIQC